MNSRHTVLWLGIERLFGLKRAGGSSMAAGGGSRADRNCRNEGEGEGSEGKCAKRATPGWVWGGGVQGGGSVPPVVQVGNPRAKRKVVGVGRKGVAAGRL